MHLVGIVLGDKEIRPEVIFCFIVASQQLVRGVRCTAPGCKLVAVSPPLTRAYNIGPAALTRRPSATQIAVELLRTQGIKGLYKGLGATLLR